jgi:hypothetical protein
MAKRKSPLRQPYRSRDRRQLTLPVFMPLQGPPQGPRTIATPWGTPPPVRAAKPPADIHVRAREGALAGDRPQARRRGRLTVPARTGRPRAMGRGLKLRLRR